MSIKKDLKKLFTRWTGLAIIRAMMRKKKWKDLTELCLRLILIEVLLGGLRLGLEVEGTG